MICQVTTLEHLHHLGWSNEKIANEIQKLVKENSPNFTVDQTFLPRTIDLLENPSNNYVFLYDAELKKIAGYIGSRPVNEASYQTIINGTFKDGDPEQNIAPMKGEVNIYVGGFMIDRLYRNQIANFKNTVAGFFSYLGRLVEQGIKVNSIVARGLSPDGQKMCMAFGMKYVLDHQVKGKIYRATFGKKEPTAASSRFAKHLLSMKTSRL
jgi:hypothetical protein